MTLITADIGATKVNMGSFAEEDGRFVLKRTERYLTKEHKDLDAILCGYLASERRETLSGLAVGVAGPVTGQKDAMTNLSWIIDTAHLSSVFGIEKVFLVNDLVACGYGIAHAEADDLVTLQKGAPRLGNKAVIAAGTGLGECGLFRYGGQYCVSASEGGHTDFGPRNEEELELLRFLFSRYRHRVSWERVVSGKFGFRNIYDFLKASGRAPQEASLAKAIQGEQEIGPQIVKAAQEAVPIATETLRLFARLYASEAGNLALKFMAGEGVYLAGGIAGVLLPWLSSPEFLAAFSDKGRMSPLLKNTPVYLVTDPHLAIKGLCHFARLALAHKSGAA